MNVGTSNKPIVVEDDMDTVESPEIADFTVSGKVLHAPHRHSKSSKHAPPTTSAPHHYVEKSGRKRGRPVSSGHRRSELQEEVRYLLEESLDDENMDVDEDIGFVSPSSAAEDTSEMLARGVGMREAQSSPPRRESRVAFEKNEGKKRTCCSAQAMSISPAPYYSAVI